MGAVTVKVPTSMRHLTGGSGQVPADGDTLRAVIGKLEANYPGLGARLVDESGALRRFVNVYVDDIDVRYEQSLDTPTPDGSTLWVISAVAGGS
ncbi:MoaD/ThiS family protein [Allorhizocola rhizosphaerae]|uniref:MoaD/ThiS family protein n=1 Tax=Allorhizocola rhizosphaerae TaxID=1872709 RepID=UPI000E3DB806|nr:MoaD/ThiS family protein [Allorhizocola rhizosphaerae]